LLYILGAILAMSIGGFAGYRYWYVPWSEYKATIETMGEENDGYELQLAKFQSDRQKLELARRRSIGWSVQADLPQAASEYRVYLQEVLHEARLTDIDMSHTTGSPKLRVVNPIPTIKDVGHQAITFNVSCKGELRQLIEALEQLAHTPYEHRIKNLTIGREDQSTKKDASSKLSITMVIETLLPSKTPIRPGLTPGVYPYILAAGELWSPIDYALASTYMHQEIMPVLPDRQYADIGKRNIFVGGLPPLPPP
jgi:hypothetical protein